MTYVFPAWPNLKKFKKDAPCHAFKKRSSGQRVNLLAFAMARVNLLLPLCWFRHVRISNTLDAHLLEVLVWRNKFSSVYPLALMLEERCRDFVLKQISKKLNTLAKYETFQSPLAIIHNDYETQAIDDQDHLVNYNNDNENDDLGYRSEEYFDEGDEEDENNHSNGNVFKRGITRLYKFRKEYGKPDGIKLSVTFDALNRISGKHRALFSSFLGDMVREHIGLKIPSRKKVKSVAAKMARSKSVYQHTMGRDRKKEIEPDKEPPRGTLWLKGRVNKDGEYPDDEIRSVGDKLDKIKEGTLKVDHGTDAMTFVLGKEKGGYARGVGSGVTYKRYFDLPRSRQASDERILLLQSQLDNERRERQEKELLIQNLSNKMSQTEGMVSPVEIHPINSSADEEGGTTVLGCDQNDASIQKEMNKGKLLNPWELEND
ncbi:reverse transcriptase domain-containing protein [Tanacetum coccineum]